MGIFKNLTRIEKVKVIKIKNANEFTVTDLRKDGNVVKDGLKTLAYADSKKNYYLNITKTIKRGRYTVRLINENSAGATDIYETAGSDLEIKVNPYLVGSIIDSRFMQQTFGLRAEFGIIIIAAIIGLIFGVLFGAVMPLHT